MTLERLATNKEDVNNYSISASSAISYRTFFFELSSTPEAQIKLCKDSVYGAVSFVIGWAWRFLIFQYTSDRLRVQSRPHLQGRDIGDAR
jgi:hypothetical protein